MANPATNPSAVPQYLIDHTAEQLQGLTSLFHAIAHFAVLDDCEDYHAENLARLGYHVADTLAARLLEASK